jgi:cyanophycinase
VSAGVLALVGGGEFSEGCTFDRGLVELAGASEVLVIPAGSAFENPGGVVERAVVWFATLGVTAVEVPVLTRRDGLTEEVLAAVRRARMVYLPGASPMHLRSVLKDSPLYDEIVGVLDRGGVVAGSGAGADVLCDPMVDTRGGAFTVGLGLVPNLTVIPRFNQWSHDKVRRTVELAPADLPVVGIPEGTALIRQDARWRSEGAGDCVVFLDGKPSALSELPVPV